VVVGPTQRRLDRRAFGGQPAQPGQPQRAPALLGGTRRQRTEERRPAVAGPLGVLCGDLLQDELTHGVEQPVARLVHLGVGQDEGPVDQVLQGVQRSDARAGQERLRGGRGEASRPRRQGAECLPARRFERRPAQLERASQRGAGPVGPRGRIEGVQAFPQPVGELGHAQQPQACGRELDRQGKPVEQTAGGGDLDRVRRSQREARQHLPRPRQEQLDRRDRAELLDVDDGLRRDRQRIQAVGHLLGEAERTVGCHDDAQSGALGAQAPDQLDAPGDQVVGVVQQQRDRPAEQQPAELVDLVEAGVGPATGPTQQRGR